MNEPQRLWGSIPLTMLPSRQPGSLQVLLRRRGDKSGDPYFMAMDLRR